VWLALFYKSDVNCVYVCVFRGVLQSLVEKHFPAPDYRMSSKFSLKKILAEDSSDDDRSLTSSGAVKRKKPLGAISRVLNILD
jgi:hypothetical protein